jgi:molecular chaperone GrpE (heat shock protein)
LCLERRRSKEQLAMWRRECRRVRNRESAAASRARVRSRIQELEVEVEDWKAKYEQAVQRLEHLQKRHGQASALGTENMATNSASL